MSTIGKVFVAVNFFLAAVVLAAAGSLLQTRAATQADLDAANTQITELESQKDQTLTDAQAMQRSLSQDKDALSQEIEAIKVQNSSLQRTNQSLTQTNSQFQADVSGLQNAVTALQETHDTVVRQNEGLVSAREDALRSEQDAKDSARVAGQQQRAAEGSLVDAERALASLQDAFNTLQGDLVSANSILEVAKSAGFDVTNVVAPPLIEATLAQVDGEYNFVILDKGRVDSVEKGFVFDVFSSGHYKGRVRVDQVHDNYATAQIMFVQDNASMERFDRATTHLY